MDTPFPALGLSQTAPVCTLPRNLSEEQVIYNDPDINLVIPAKAGIQAAYRSFGDNYAPLDSRFRGNDEGKAVPLVRAGSRAQAGSAALHQSLPASGAREQHWLTLI